MRSTPLLEGGGLPSAPGPSSRRGARLNSLDMVRGLIIMIMAWDHGKDILWNNEYYGKMAVDAGFQAWSGHLATYEGRLDLFVARFISHFCAPGFFFTMGIGMSLFTASRRRREWSWCRIVRHFLVRGAVLFVVGRLVNWPFFARTLILIGFRNQTVTHFGHSYGPNDVSTVWVAAWVGVFEVMTGLSVVMAAAGMLLPILFVLRARWPTTAAGVPFAGRRWKCSAGALFALVGSVAIFTLSNAVLVYFQRGDPEASGPFPNMEGSGPGFGGFLVRLLLIPGAGPPPLGHIAYPLIPWLGVTLLGMSAGTEYAEDATSAQRRTLIFSGISLALFLVIRLVGGPVGNLRGWPRGDGLNVTQNTVNETTGAIIGTHEIHVPAIIEFFNVCKYPPSVAFTSLTLAANLLGLFCFQCFAFLAEAPADGPRANACAAPAGAALKNVAEAEAGSTELGTKPVPELIPSTSASTSTRPLPESVGQTAPRGCCVRRCCYMSPCPSRLVGWLLMPPLVYGRTPLFFYILHFWMWAGIGMTIFVEGLPIRAIIPVWVVVLALLYPLCDAYGHFKRATSPNSLWRFL